MTQIALDQVDKIVTWHEPHWNETKNGLGRHYYWGGSCRQCAANELADRGISVLVIDRGRDIKERHCPMEEAGKCAQCKQCDIMCGVGGASLVSQRAPLI